MPPLILPDTLKIFCLMMVNHQIQDGGGLKEAGFGTAFPQVGPDAIHKVRLQSEQLRKDGHNETGFAIFHGAQDNAFCFVNVHRLKNLLCCVNREW